MSVLCINLKQFYQRRAMWLVYFVAAAMSLGLGAAFFDYRPVDFGRGVFVLPAIWMYGVGFLVGTMIVTSWSKPMAYCLPGHHRTSLRIMYGACLIFVLGSLTTMIWLPREVLMFRSVFVLAYLSLNLLAFWLGAGTASGGGQWFGFLPTVILLFMIRDMHVKLEGAMSNLFQASLVCMICWMFTAYIVWRFRKRQTVRDICNKPWTSMFDSMNVEKVRSLARQRQAVARKAKHSRLAEVVNQWFCLQMAQQGAGLPRLLWAVAYHTVGRYLLAWKGIMILSLMGTLYMGYMSRVASPFVLVMVCFLTSQMAAATAGGCALLKTDGRRQRFKIALAGSLVSQALVMVFLLGMILLSYGLAPLLPALPPDGRPTSFHTLDWRLLLLPLAIIPALGGIGLLFPKKSHWFFMATVGVGFPGLMLLFTNDYLQGLDSSYVGLYVLLVCLSWGILVACNHWHCFRRDLQ